MLNTGSVAHYLIGILGGAVLFVFMAYLAFAPSRRAAAKGISARH
jgi:hypothetical protein